MDVWLTILLLIFISFCIEWLFRKLKLGNFQQRYVVVTGCDTGFGNMLAKRLDVMQFRVFAACYTDKAVKLLTEECSQNMTAIQVDVSNVTSIEKMVEVIKIKLPKDKGKCDCIAYRECYTCSFNEQYCLYNIIRYFNVSVAYK